MEKGTKKYNRNKYFKNVMIVMLVFGLVKASYCSMKDNSFEIKDYSYFEAAMEHNEIQQISYRDAHNWMLITTKEGNTYKVRFPGKEQIDNMRDGSVTIKHNVLYLGEVILDIIVIAWGTFSVLYFFIMHQQRDELYNHI